MLRCLSPKFELWVFATIDDIIFGEYKRLQKELTTSAHRKNRIEELEMELGDVDEFREWEQLKKEERRAAYKRGKAIKNQRRLFRNRL